MIVMLVSVLLLCALMLLLMIQHCAKDTVSYVMLVVVNKVTNAYAWEVVDGKSELVSSDGKSLLRLAAPIKGIIKDAAGNYVVADKTEIVVFDNFLFKLFHMAMDNRSDGIIIERLLEAQDNQLMFVRNILRGATIDIEARITENVNEETGVINSSVSYDINNVTAHITDEEMFMFFMDYCQMNNYSEFMIKMLAKKFGIEI